MNKPIAVSPQRNPATKPLLAGLAMAAALAFSHPAKAMVSISVRFAPPPLLVYEQPMIPEPGYLWVPGYWAWDGDIDDYYWVPGQWVLPPFSGAMWTPGYWGWRDGVYFFHRGYWGPTVGYYGGINYGFGYFGVDYVGGYWNRGVFNYNRTYNRIDNRVVNVYNNNTTVINKTVINNTRVSYNGGPGGVNVQPTLQQRENERQRHWDAVPEQRAVVQQAREDRTAHYGYNHGQADKMQWRGAQPMQPASAAPRPRAQEAMNHPIPQPPVIRPQPLRRQEWQDQQAPRHAQWREQPPHERMQPQVVRATPQPYMHAMPQQPRMQPMPVHAPPASHPAPQQHAAGNPHRDRRDHEHGD